MGRAGRVAVVVSAEDVGVAAGHKAVPHLRAMNGRIAGISGIFSGTLFAEAGDKLWRILFVIGLIAGYVICVVTAQAQVIDTLVIGPLTRITLDAQGTRMTSIQMTDALGPVTPGATVRIGFPADAARVFAPLSADLATAFGDHA